MSKVLSRALSEFTRLSMMCDPRVSSDSLQRLCLMTQRQQRTRRSELQALLSLNAKRIPVPLLVLVAFVMIVNEVPTAACPLL